MLEKDIENLIANFPNEFFPNSGFKLIGQQVKLGRCYADIIFEDKFFRKIIVEIKRGILSREASGQIMEYYGLLKDQNPTDNVELVLCANVIPVERKTFLENVGIECKELGINFINQIAKKVGYNFIDAPKFIKEDIINANLPFNDNVWIFQANPERYDILNALADEEMVNVMHWQVNQYKNDIIKGHIGMIWLSGKEAGIYAITEIVSNPEFMVEPEAERRHWREAEDTIGSKLRVKMRILINLLSRPLTKDIIKSTNGLQNLSILKQPRGTNFKVTSTEWGIIKELIYN